MKPGPKPRGRQAGKIVATCSAEYEIWVKSLARAMRCSIPSAIDRGLAELGRSVGFAEPAPERIPRKAKD